MDSTFSAASRSLRDSFSRLSSEARSFSSRSSKTKSPNCKQTPCPRGAAQLAAAPPGSLDLFVEGEGFQEGALLLGGAHRAVVGFLSPHGGIVKRREDDGPAKDGGLFAAMTRRLLDHGELALGKGQDETAGPFGPCRREGLRTDVWCGR